MSKKESYEEVLRSQLQGYLQDGKIENLKVFIEANSNLPGPRANLEFTSAFGELIAKDAETHSEALWELCIGLVDLSPKVAPVNNPKEFIPFCGAVGIGALGAATETCYSEALAILKQLSRDRRWRMREAVRMGLQEMMRAYRERTLDGLQSWIPAGQPLEMRAAVVTVSDLEFLLDQDFAKQALDLHVQVFEKVKRIEDRKEKSFRALRKALGYTISLVICAIPEAGMALIDELIASKDTDLIWIARSNLKKRRVLRNFPEQAESRLKGL